MDEGPSTRKLMHLNLEMVNYFPYNLLINVKIIQMSNKTSQLISRREKNWNKAYMRRWLGFFVKYQFRRGETEKPEKNMSVSKTVYKIEAIL